MSNLRDEQDLSSKENILIHMLILGSISFVISFIITIWFFIKKCKKGNIFNLSILIVFNLAIGFSSLFPLMACYDNYLTTMEKIEVYDARELEPIRKHIKTYFKCIHYLYFIFSDIIIPTGITFYYKIYLNQKEEGKKYKFFSCSILKGFIFLIFIIGAFVVAIIVIISVLPEPKIDELKEKTEGWDGIMFNIRNSASLAECELNIFLSFFLLALKGIYYMRWITCCCKCKKPPGEQFDIYVYFQIGKLIEKKELKNKDKLSDFDMAEKELLDERNDALADKIIKYYKDEDMCCNECKIPRFLYEFFYGFFLFLFSAFILIYDNFNTFGKIKIIDLSNIKSEYEKSEEKEKMRDKIISSYLIYFILFFPYYIAITYSIVQRKFHNEYFPYIGSEHNGLGFLILLKYILRIQTPIYFIIFFQHINKDFNPIISSYFKLFRFTVDYSYWPIIKGLSMPLIIIFACCGCKRDGIFKVFREEYSNEYVIKGSKKFKGEIDEKIEISMEDLSDNGDNDSSN